MNNFKWGLGLELERMVFKKKNNKYYAIDINKLFKNRDKSILETVEIDLLNKLPYLEKSGRKCIINIKGMMYEMVTDNPINKTIEEGVEELKIFSKRYLSIFQKLNKAINKDNSVLIYSPISTLKFIDIDGKTKISNTGSLHINITFPFKRGISDKKYIEFYKKFIHLFNWISPLIYATTTSGHTKTAKYNNYVKCCHRLSNGWGIAGGTELNTLDKGQPRMASQVPKYTKNLKNYKKTITNNRSNCLIARSFYDKASHGINLTPYFTDIATIYKINRFNFLKYFVSERTISKFDERRFSTGYGIEIRLFDDIEPKHILEILRFIIYLGSHTSENLKKTEITDLKNDDTWNGALSDILQNGYKTKFDELYIYNLFKKLNMPLKKTNSRNPQFLLNLLSDYLYKKYNKHAFTKCMTEHYKSPPRIFNMNKKFLNLSKKL